MGPARGGKERLRLDFSGISEGICQDQGLEDDQSHAVATYFPIDFHFQQASLAALRRPCFFSIPEGEIFGGAPSGVRDRRACNAAWFEYWRGRAALEPCASPRRRRAGAWQSC